MVCEQGCQLGAAAAKAGATEGLLQLLLQRVQQGPWDWSSVLMVPQGQQDKRHSCF